MEAIGLDSRAGADANGACEAVELASLLSMLADARARTLALLEDLTGPRALGPRLAILNPPLWELGHVGWFEEYWCLRQRADGTVHPSKRGAADRLYDSSRVAHATRWDLPLLPWSELHDYLEAVRADVIRAAECGDVDPYFLQLALFHEDMHGEAFVMMRQWLGYQAPRFLTRNTTPSPLTHGSRIDGDAEIPGGTFELGARPGGGFAFDNEKWAHPVELAPFRIARAAVRNHEFAAFVDDEGYGRRELWSDDGWRWRMANAATAPVYWRREDGVWLERKFDRWQPLVADAPVVNVCWFEADAWCRWAGRRLPTEGEWELAAATSAKRRYPWGEAPPRPELANLDGWSGAPTDVAAFAAGDSAYGCRQMLGNIWEWVADWFAPYPGFVIDPYADYSRPWFGDHKVLRGGSFATRARLLRNTWRNFYRPDRRDVFAGFRTCAEDRRAGV